MKRYLIYGFLTILIITLNFAFIIVLITDDVRINYRVLFLLWAVVLIAAGGLAYLEKTRKNKERIASMTPSHSTTKESISTTKEVAPPSNIYKNKCIQKARIKLSEDFTHQVKPGFFAGYVANEDYSNEIVQAVYTNQGQLLGFINKKKTQLCENLELLYHEPVVCWGNIHWGENEKRFIAKIFIPILYSEPEVNRFKKMAELKEELIHLEAHMEETNIHLVLEKAETLHFLQQSKDAPISLEHAIDPEILPNLSKELSYSGDWKGLAKLKKYPILISTLSEPKKNEVLSSIDIAERKFIA